MISDLDGARLRAATAATGGVATVRFSRDEVLEVPTTWAGVPSSFSAGGLTPFGKALKPDIMAPGSQVLSSTLPEFAGDPFAILDGTSFSAPHIAGAAALLLQRHPSWTPQQLKSALMSTAGPAWADSSLTREESVIVQGAGLANVSAADKPLIFTDPQSLSFGYLSALGGATSKTIPVLVVRRRRRGGDVGRQRCARRSRPRARPSRPLRSRSRRRERPDPDRRPRRGRSVRGATTSASSSSVGTAIVRRIPYAFHVTRPQLTGSPTTPLRPTQRGDTRTGGNRANVYRWPTSPFGILGIFGVDPSVDDDGSEKVYTLDIPRQAVNAGVVVTRPPHEDQHVDRSRS